MDGETELRATYRFRVVVEDDSSLWFQEITGLNMPLDPPQTTPKRPRLPGVHKFINITCKKGVADSEPAQNWAATAGQTPGRRNLRVILLGEDGSDVNVYQLPGAWPIKCSISEFGIESLEIAWES